MIFTVALALANPALSNELLPPITFTMEPSVVCPMIGGMAEALMIKRQDGVPISDAIEAMEADSDFIPLVLEAYRVPRYVKSENKFLAVTEFRNEIEIICYQGANPASAEAEEFCTTYAEGARAVMELRQKGYSKSQLLKAMKDFPEASDTIEAAFLVRR